MMMITIVNLLAWTVLDIIIKILLKIAGKNSNLCKNSNEPFGQPNSLRRKADVWLAYSASPVTAGIRVLHLQLSDGSTYGVGTTVTSRLRLVIPVCVTLSMVGLLIELWIWIY